MLVVGQAPGRRVHASGRPFTDPSGDRLRSWLGVDEVVFYDPTIFALLPMGFCYPGTGRAGDLPPRPECAATWREQLLAQLTAVRVTLLLGRHAMAWHLPDARGTLGEIVAQWQRYAPTMFVAPHPSPRNQGWLKRHRGFETEVLPALRAAVAAAVVDPAPVSPDRAASRRKRSR